MLVDVSLLEVIEDVDDHIFDLYTRQVGKDLGYIEKSDELLIELDDGTELKIKQNIAELNSSSSSTGFICWKSSRNFANWAKTSKCPFNLKDVNILELGSGIGGVLASSLGKCAKSFVASDQKPILKLLAKNLKSNGIENIEIIELDWEESYELPVKPDAIITCDTIYNEYLLTPLLSSIKSCLTFSSGAIVVAQLRDWEIFDLFVRKTLEYGLKLYSVPFDLLSDDLKGNFVIYYIELVK